MPFDWTINPYRGCTHACVYCFARSTHTYLDMDAGRDFETKIVVKVNAPDVLRRELAARPLERRAHRDGDGDRSVPTGGGPVSIDARDHRCPDGTPEPLLDPHEGNADPARPRPPRARRARSPTSPRRSRSAPWTRKRGAPTEPGTPHPRARLEAVAALNDAGVPCSVLVAPILPGHHGRARSAPRRRLGGDRRRGDAGLADPAPPATGRPRAVPPVARGALSRSWFHATCEMYRRSYGPPSARQELGARVAGIVRSAGGLRPRASVAGSTRFGRRRQGPDVPEHERPTQLRML